ncbi:MAG: YitT family protein [Oscillospiraceae bacterium]|nr:YitT family protein [Oscillospiraceae bacterium]
MINKRTIQEFLIITVGTLIVSTAVFFFMLPSHVSVGSGTALAMVLSNFIPLPISVITLILNIVLLLLGFLLIGPEFGAKTVYCAILMPVFLGVYEIIFPNQKSLTEDPFLDVLCYIFVVGVGLAILFRRNASSGGLDIVAKLMNKFLRMELGKAMSLSGMLVALSSALVYDKKTVVISVLGTYLGGLVVDHFIFGMDLKRRVCIISPRLDEIVDFILHDLHSGATLNNIIGAYDRNPKQEVITIVDKQEYKALMDYVKRVDPKAFITVYSVNEISYQPKK